MYNDINEYYEYLKCKKIIVSTEPNSRPLTKLDVFNEHTNWFEINDLFEKNRIVIIDNVLKKEYVERLRNYMLCLNVRHDIYSDYAAVNFCKDGLWFDLLEQIADQFKEKLKFLKELNYNRSWSFIYNNQGNGPDPHFDPGSLITGNLWVTPDECMNIDNEYNGFEIWNILHPNHNLLYDQQLEKSFFNEIVNNPQVTKHTVTYKFNRIVFFDGRYVHRSQPVSSKSGYENRKINYTFLYNTQMEQ